MARRLPGALLAATLLAAALPASAQPVPPVSLTEERGLLRHEPTGVALPESLGGIKRAANFPGSPAVVIYAPRGSQSDDLHRFAIAIGAVSAAPNIERMRDQTRRQAGGGTSRETLFEGAFAWPARPEAITFRGSYVVGKVRKQYWHAWAGGYGITVMVEWTRDEPEQMEKIAAAVAEQVFGGAAPGR